MYLWSNPNLPHWQRLALGVFYLPVLFWWWITGKPIYLASGTTQRAVDFACTCAAIEGYPDTKVLNPACIVHGSQSH
jgi:hypothetical protein